MSTQYLGPVFDIHTVGLTWCFRITRTKIAQSHGANGHPPVKCWCTTATSTSMGSAWGSRSATSRRFRASSSSIPARWFATSSSPTITASPSTSATELTACGKALARLESAVANALFATGMKGWTREQLEQAVRPETQLAQAITAAKASFEEAMDDDFNTAGAIAALHELATALNTYVNQGIQPGPGQSEPVLAAVAAATLAMAELGDVVGILDLDTLLTAHATAETGAEAGGDGDAKLVESLIRLLLDVRAEARAMKQYALSDKIRGELSELGIVVEDTRDGARWKRVSQ